MGRSLWSAVSDWFISLLSSVSLKLIGLSVFLFTIRTRWNVAALPVHATAHTIDAGHPSLPRPRLNQVSKRDRGELLVLTRALDRSLP